MRNHSAGMTLIELLIVLALMAGLATFALKSMDDMSARSRYETSRNRLESIERAMVGDGIRVGRFLSDMGRLPMVQAANGPWEGRDGIWLNELWEAPAAIRAANEPFSVLPGHGFIPLTGTLHTGWAGPYFQPLHGRIFDGFGHGFTSSVVLAQGALVPDAISLGRDGAPGGTDWMNQDLAVFFDHMTNATLHVQVMGISTQGTERVWTPVSSLFRSGQVTHAAVALIVPEIGLASRSVAVQSRLLSDAGGSVHYTGLVPGTRKVLAWATAGTNGWWSDVHTVEIGRGNQHITLYLTREMDRE